MARKKRGLQEINAGSMADIAFLLLIFFLVTTTMDVDTGIARKLPPMPEEEQETPPEIHARNIYVVLVNAGDISPSLVAGGIKVALLTPVFGLIVAIILQIFYNYLVSKIDNLVNDMEDASIKLVDLLSKK